MCTFNDGRTDVSCKPENFCHNPKLVSYEIDWSAKESLHNWIEKLDITCASEWQISLIGSSYFIGWIVTLFVVPRFADIYGRKWIFRIGMTIQLAAFTAVMFTHNLYVMIGAIFIIGACCTVRSSIGYILMMEFMPPDR